MIKNLLKIQMGLFLVLLLLLALPGRAYAQSSGEGQVVFGGTFTLEEGKTLDGDLVVFGGTASLKERSSLNGDVLITGGVLEILGKVEGSVTAIGGAIKIGESAIIEGDLTAIGGSISRDPGAQIQGKVNIGSPGSFDLRIPTRIIDTELFAPAMLDRALMPVGRILTATIQAVMLALLAMLIALFLPRPMEQIAQTIAEQPVLSGGIGLLTLIVYPALILLLAITILLIPVALIGVLVALIALLLGWIALGFEAGRRLAVMLKQEWALPVSAGLGTLIVSLIAAFFNYIWCIGWLVPFLISIISLGAVIISRFGARAYLAPAPAVPLSSPPPPIVDQPPAELTEKS